MYTTIGQPVYFMVLQAFSSAAPVVTVTTFREVQRLPDLPPATIRAQVGRLPLRGSIPYRAQASCWPAVDAM